jgi:nicotinamide mononucleotide transporter
MDLYLEIIAVLFGIAYLFFLIKEHIICWLFGVIGSLFSILLFYRAGLYSESVLYVYYVIIGIYGFVYWNKSTRKNKEFTVTDLPTIKYVYLIVLGAVLSNVLGYCFDNYTDASAPYLDAHTTIFSFIASYLEVNKWLASWKFWIVINAVTIILYFNKDFELYTALTIVYLVFSFVGYNNWNRKMKSLK